MAIDPTLLGLLVCPKHKTALYEADCKLYCGAGHDYPVVDGIPVILEAGAQTLWVADASLRQARHPDPHSDPFYIDTLGISESERTGLRKQLSNTRDYVDPVVSFLVGATNGIAYKPLIGALQDYPIPELRLPPANGQVLLDIGCNWGRWCMAAARLGYTPIGIDPSLGAVLAAKRAAAQLGANAKFVVGDARFLPFRTRSLDVVHSYSVIQHFGESDATSVIKEIGRVLVPHGRSFVQMPTIFGLRCAYHQARRMFREARGFEVRYWSIPALRSVFSKYIGHTDFLVDCFFSIGMQSADARLMKASHRLASSASDLLKLLGKVFSEIYYVADSVYVDSIKCAE